MQFKSPLLLAVFGSALVFGDAAAVGIGRPVASQVLGGLLDIPVSVRLTEGEALETECIMAQVQIGDLRVPGYDLHFAIEATRDPLERVVRVSAPARVDEPVVSLSLTAGCRTRMTRHFTVLADPPGSLASVNTAEPPTMAVAAAGRADPVEPPLPRISTSDGVMTIPTALPPSPPEPPVAAGVASTPAARRAAKPPNQATAPVAANRPAPRASARAPHRGSSRAALAAASKPAGTVKAGNRTASATVAESRPRLKLDLSEAIVQPGSSAVALAASAAAFAAPSPTAMAATATATASAAGATDAASAAEAAASAAQARVRQLEQQVQRLMAESAAQRASATRVTAAQSAERGEDIGWLPPMLGLLLALVSALALWLGFRLRASANAEAVRWWADEAADVSRARAAESKPWPVSRNPVKEASVTVGVLESTLGSSGHDLKDAPRVATSIAKAHAREVTVEELIDLEQQAEFFIVLGQDEAAIDLLVGHVRDSGGTSPLPYLKLLEIYRRRDDHTSYERTRGRFNQRFNAYAPDWDSDLQHGRSLDDYPQVVDRLQRTWPRPLDAMAELGALLFRKDGGELFDLPAYREVLLLFSLARELLDNQETRVRDVDVLLPIGESHFDATGTGPHLLERLAGDSIFATGSAFDRPTRSADLDMDLDIGPSSGATRPAPLDEAGDDGAYNSGMIDLSDLDDRR
jgi:hypothetical protein